jgi:hypothetical protein
MDGARHRRTISLRKAGRQELVLLIKKANMNTVRLTPFEGFADELARAYETM